MRFVSDVIFPLQLYDRYMYSRFCTNQAIYSGQNLLNWAAETIWFEVSMTKESRQFPHYYIIKLLLYSCVSIVVTSITADYGF